MMNSGSPAGPFKIIEMRVDLRTEWLKFPGSGVAVRDLSLSLSHLIVVIFCDLIYEYTV